MKKRRSDIQKLVTASRDVWRFSEGPQAIRKRCKHPEKRGWFVCELNREEVEVIRIDHIIPIGEQPKAMRDFGKWLPKLFCKTSNLQGLCNYCHSLKTESERSKRKKK